MYYPVTFKIKTLYIERKNIICPKFTIVNLICTIMLMYYFVNALKLLWLLFFKNTLFTYTVLNKQYKKFNYLEIKCWHFGSN